MYTAVLMATLTTGGATPDWGCFRCGGCYCGCACHCSCGRYGSYGTYGTYCGCACYRCGCACFHRGCYGGVTVNFCHSCGGFACYGCYGCQALNCHCGWSCYGVMPPVLPYPQPVPKDKKGKEEEELQAQSRARLIVEVPAEAKVYIDGNLMKTNATRRVYSTPVLQQGQTYFYDVKAEVMREGQPVTQTQRVQFRIGQIVQANFGDMATPATTARNQDD